MAETPGGIGVIVLAAGQGTRFAAATDGAHKLLADLDGAPLVRHAVTAALGSSLRPVVVVTGHRRAEVLQALKGLDFAEAYNPAHAMGMASSLKAGVAAMPAGIAGVVVLLGDMPRIGSGLPDRLARAFADHPGVDAAAPVFKGRRGNPILLSSRLFSAIAKLEGDEGARRLLSGDARVIEIEATDDSVSADVDTPEALASLRKPR